MRCLLIDFSKAFVSVDHLIVINKLKALNIADNIIHWDVSFLTDRNQFVEVGERWSFTKMINRSIVQGSGVGPTLFTICIIDLQPIGFSNRITKYADDCRLMVPEKCDVDMLDEFQHVLHWAVASKLTINMCKTKELVFHRPNSINYLAPSELPGIERVLCAKLLGVWLQNYFSMRKHVDYIMHICNQRSYLLTQLERQCYGAVAICI